MAGEAKSLPSRLLSLAWKLCAEDPMSRRADEVESESDFPRLCVCKVNVEKETFSRFGVSIGEKIRIAYVILISEPMSTFDFSEDIGERERENVKDGILFIWDGLEVNKRLEQCPVTPSLLVALKRKNTLCGDLRPTCFSSFFHARPPLVVFATPPPRSQPRIDPSFLLCWFVYSVAIYIECIYPRPAR